jgi:hypothetical protein
MENRPYGFAPSPKPVIKLLGLAAAFFAALSFLMFALAYHYDRDVKDHCVVWQTDEYGSVECIGTTCVHITRQVETCIQRDDE